MTEPKFQESKRELCDDLVAAREARGLDLAKISERTKISMDYLINLESGEWAFLPASYVRAFLRTYAQTVGLDIGNVLDRYDNIIGTAPSTTPKPAIPDSDYGKRSRSDSRSSAPKFTLADDSRSSGSEFELSPAMIYTGVGVVIVAILFAIWFFLISPNLDSRDQDVSEIPFEEVVRETQGSDTQADLNDETIEMDEGSDQVSGSPANTSESARPGELTAIESDSAPGSTSPSLTLVANVNQPCYVRVTADHDTSNVIDTILSTGSSRSFAADSVFRVVIGNTNGVELLLNNRRLQNIGARGRVVTLTIDRAGIRRAEAGNRDL